MSDPLPAWRAFRERWRVRLAALTNSGPDAPWTALGRVLAWAIAAWDELRRGALMVGAAALAFWLLLSFVPALALLFAILQAFGMLDAVRPFLLGSLAAGNAELVERIAQLVESARGAALGGAGILSLLLAGYQVLHEVKGALNRVWNAEAQPGYASRLIEYLTVLAVAPFLILLPVMASAVLRHPAVRAIVEGWSPLLQVQLTVAEYSGYPLYAILLFYAYRFLPDARVNWRAALLGAAVASVLLNAGQSLYLRTVFRITEYNAMYGALALLPFLMVWLFLAAIIFLFGAHLAYVAQHHGELAGRRRLKRYSGAARAMLAVHGLLAVMALFRESGAPVPSVAFAKRLRVPDSSARAILSALRNAGLLVSVEGGAEQVVPALPLEPLTLRETLTRLEALPVFPPADAFPKDAAGEPLARAMREAEAALEFRLGETTLGALLPAARD